MTLNRTTNESVAGTTANRGTRTFNGLALLKYRVGQRIILVSGFSRYLQNSHQQNAPDLATNWYTIGISTELN